MTPKPKSPKAAKVNAKLTVRGRILHVANHADIYGKAPYCLWPVGFIEKDDKPVLVLPADEASVQALIYQVAKVICWDKRRSISEMPLAIIWKAQDVLESLGVTLPAKPNKPGKRGRVAR